MKVLRAVSLSLLWGWGSGAMVRPALADALSCPAFAVEADDDVKARWPELAERVERAFAGRDGIDSCARVKLTTHPDSIEMEVSLADGRSASRSVRRREDVIPTLEALLFVPRAEATKPEPEPEPELEAEVEPEPELEPEPKPESESVVRPRRTDRLALPTRSWLPRERQTPERANEPSTNRLGIELAVVTGARVGDGQSCLSLGALTLLDVSGWLVGFQGRANGYMQNADVESQSTLELAALGGRRIPLRSLALDLIAGPALAIDAGGRNETGPAHPEQPGAEPEAVPRLLLASHLSFSTRAVLRGFVGVEGELGPTHEGNSPRLPAWMVGFAVGAAVGTR